MVFQSCQKLEELKLLSEEAVLLQAKNWFERDLKKRSSSQNKSNDPLLQARREPDWQKIWQANHRDAPLLEMPLEYEGKHLLGKSQSEWGSRLGVTRLLLRRNEDGTFKPVIMRIFADSTYLSKNGNQFDYNTFKNQESDFTGEILFYDWEENYLGANRYQNGQITHYSQATTNKSQIYCIEIPISYWATDDSQLGDMGSTRTISGGYWATTIQLYCWVEIAGGSGSGGSGPSGGGPANGFDPYCIDCGDGGDTGGNGFGLLPPPDISPELLKITRDWYTMSDERWKAVDEVFKKGLQNPYLKMMYDQLAIEPTFTFSMETFTDTSNPDENEKLGSYRDEFFFENNQSSRGIRLNEKLFTDPAYKQFLMVTLFAEMTHAYQHSVYGNTDYKKLKESVNLECEQRFFIEFVDYMSRDDTGKGIFKLTDGYSFAGSEKDQKLLESWLETIKQSPNSKPTLDNVKQKFLEFFMPRFKEVWKNTDYGKLTILLNEILYAILLLFS